MLTNQNLYHEFLFGNVLGNIIVILGLFKYLRKRIKKKKEEVSQFIAQHEEMYEYYCRQLGKKFNSLKINAS